MAIYGTYMSETVYYEPDYGNVTERIVVSSTYDELFISRADYLAAQPFVDILTIGTSKHDVALESGSYAEDELSIKMNQAAINNAYSKLCYQLVLQSQDITYPLYIAYFIQPDDTNSDTIIESAEFIGVIQPEMKAKELIWQNTDEYDPDTQPIYEWELKAKSVDLSLFDSDKLEDIIKSLHEDTTWRTENIEDRLAWCDLGGGKVTKFANLVNLNKANTKLAELQAELISTRINSTVTIVIDECILDEKFSPARWVNSNRSYSKLEAAGGYHTEETRYIGRFGEHGVPVAVNKDYVIYTNDAQTLKIGDNVLDEDSPFITSHLLFWDDISSVDGSPQNNRTNSFVEKSDITFADYMIGIAGSFGLIVTFYMKNANEIHVKIQSKKDFVQEYCYIPDADESDINTAPFNKSEAKTVYGIACQWCDEGASKAYLYNNSQDPTKDGYIESVSPMKATGADKLLLTISPTVRHLSVGDCEEITSINAGTNRLLLINSRMPHNGIITDENGNRRDDTTRPDAIWNAIGLHTAIYLKTRGKETLQFPNGPSSGYYINHGVDGQEIWSPAAAAHYKYDGLDKTVYTQAEYVNFIRGTEQQAYTTEKNITVPYLCRFRKTQAGTDPDDDGGRGRWQNLKLGNKITFGAGGTAITYIVTGIERDSETKSTKIKLWNNQYFSFATATGLISSVSPDGENNNRAVPAVNSGIGLASGSVQQYNVVIQNDDGSYSKAEPIESHVGRYCGIAMNSANDGEELTILPAGLQFLNPLWNFTVRTPLYLCRNIVSADNVSDTILSVKNGKDCVALLIAYAKDGLVDTVDFDNIDNQIILEE